jgi:lipopolysaccharide export system protein LptA
MRTPGRSPLLAVLLIGAALGTAPAFGQPSSGPPNALQGFSQNRDKPVQIDSASLEVRDKEKMATFAGNVHLVQGDVTLKCQTLVVYYEADPAKPGAAAPASASQQGNQQIKRIEAKGGVVVLQKDQKASGDTGIFEMKSNTVTLLGNVIISQGPNIVKGDRLAVDLTTGVSRVECGKGTQCRVQALLQPGSQTGSRLDTPSGAIGLSDQPREQPKPRNTSPSGLY